MKRQGDSEDSAPQRKKRRTKYKSALSYGKKRRNVDRGRGKVKAIATMGKADKATARSKASTSVVNHENRDAVNEKRGEAAILTEMGSSIDSSTCEEESGEAAILPEMGSSIDSSTCEEETCANADSPLKDSDILEAYFKACIEALADGDTLDSLVRKLHEADVLDDFIVLVTSLANGMFDPLNIVFLLCMERCRFETLKSTTQMRYRDKTKLFWKLLYKETSGRSIRMACGPKNKGAVVQKRTTQGCFDPQDSMTNFAVPDIKVLSSSDSLETNLPKEIQPGLIHASIDLLPSDTDLVLLGDGKGLARGQLPGGRGDVDMFGHEEPPTKQQLQERSDLLHAAVDTLKKDMSFDNLLDLTTEVSVLIQMLNNRSGYFDKRRQGMVKRFAKENNQKSYSAGISWVNGMDYKVRAELEKLFQLNGEMASLMTHLKGTHNQFLAGDSGCLSNISNLKLLKNPETLVRELYDLDSAGHLVKPGTVMWYEQRLQAYVTADTVFRAIGLGGVAAMKQCYKLIVDDTAEETGVTVTPRSNLGVIASKIVPILYPDAVVEEVGVYFKDTEQTQGFIAASPDCIIRCENGNIIPVICHSLQAFNSARFLDISDEDLCRALCEMHVLDAAHVMLATFVPGRVLVQLVDMDTNLAKKIFETAVEIYEQENVKDIEIPKSAEMTWRTEIVTALKGMRVKHKNEHSVLCFPSATIPDDGNGNTSEYEVAGPFMGRAPKRVNDISEDFMASSMKSILEICEHHITSAHALLRPQADEIFAIMATDTDRISKVGVPAQVPVAYGLKGGGLPTYMLRNMMDEVKDELQSRNLNVVCEIFDGYHHTYMERDSAGTPLYQTRLQQDTWTMFSGLGKAKLIDKLEELSAVKLDLPKLSEHEKLESESITVGNVFLVHTTEFPCPRKKRDCGMLMVSSRGGPLQQTGAMEKIHSSTGWFSNHGDRDGEIDFSSTSIAGVLLPEDMLDIAIDYTPEEGETRIVAQAVSFVVLHQSRGFIEALVATFKEQNKKWKKLTPEILLRQYLRVPDAMLRNFSGKNMSTVGQAVKDVTDKELFPKDCKSKSRRSSVISLFFGGTGEVTGLVLEPSSLKELSRTCLMHTKYPAEQLKVALADVYHCYRKKEWVAECGWSLHQQVAEGETIEMFSYPEFHHARSKYEPKVTDPYHILTNLRKGATSGNYPDLCDTEAWKKVVRKDKTLLTTSIVEDNIDKQSGALARRIFSEAVQKIMIEEGEKNKSEGENKDLKTAEFVYHVRNFIEACDTRGLSADERIAKFVDFHKYLMSGVSFDTFPPQGAHVKGIPIVTFEAILANISTRIQLYSICRNKTYNHRAVSSLPCENFFSTLANTSPTGCPRATDIPRVMSQIVSLNHYKHLSPEELGFHFQTANKLTYEVHTLDDAGQVIENQPGFWKNHNFDCPQDKKKKSKYDKASFTHDLKPLKGVRPIRSSFYKIDEQKLDTLRRMGVDSAELLRFGIPMEWQLTREEESSVPMETCEDLMEPME